jgi:hypothetical protein
MKTHHSSRVGWRWTLVLLGGLAWASIGCSPQTLAIFMMPFTDNNIQPEHKLFASDRELTLAFVSNFAVAEIHHDLREADAELADQMINAFKDRAQKNKHRIKFIPTAQVQGEQLKQKVVGGALDPAEIGRVLKADYVIDVKLNSFGIYEKNFHPPMYRGKADLTMTLYKVDAKAGEHRVFSKELPRVFPANSPPIQADGISASAFRSRFLAVLAGDVAKVFLAYPMEERRVLEH